MEEIADNLSAIVQNYTKFPTGLPYLFRLRLPR